MAAKRPGDLKRPGHAQTADGVRRQAGDVGFVEDDPAGSRFEGSGHRIEQGGLAGAVRADQAHDRPSFDGEVHLAERLHAAEGLADVATFQ